MAASEGITRECMAKFAKLLVAKLPASLQASVGEYSLRGLGDSGERAGIATIHVVKTQHVAEIVGILNKKLKSDKELFYRVGSEERKLYAVAERPEGDKQRYRVVGKLKEKASELRSKLGDKKVGDACVVWKPAFAVKDAMSLNSIASVSASGALVVDDALCAEFLGITGLELKRLVAGTL